VGNISLGSSATALSVLLNREVQITTPRLEVLEMSEIQLDYPLPCLAVEVDYTVGLEGSNLLLIKESDAIIIAALMMNEPYEGKEGPMGEIEQSAVQEAMNQMMGSMATSMTGSGKSMDSRSNGRSGAHRVSPVAVYFKPTAATISPA